MTAGPEPCLRPPSGERPDYGIDAPPVILVLLLIGAAALAATFILRAMHVRPIIQIGHAVNFDFAPMILIVGAVSILNAIAMLYYSKRGKLRLRERLLNEISWRGDESVLDVGCGRGLFLIGAARRLDTGRAIGVDIWRNADLGGNSPVATLENARRENVADRVETRDADARELPFPDKSFDVVLSSLAIHNIKSADGRRQAIREMARVLKPAGRLLITDIQHTKEYARILKEAGLIDIRRRFIGPTSPVAVLLTFGSVIPFRLTASAPAGSA